MVVLGILFLMAFRLVISVNISIDVLLQQGLMVPYLFGAIVRIAHLAFLN